MQKCRGCGKEIVFADLVDDQGIFIGKSVPLDPKPPVYEINSDGTAERRRGAMVSHFATCTEANRFSGSRKKVSNG